MSEVTVIGEALVDIVNRDGAVASSPGGSPMNVAVGLSRLGVPVSLVAAIGHDELGAMLRSHLDASGVDLSALIPAEHTSSARAHLNDDGSAEYEFDIEWSLPSETIVPSSRLLHIGSIGSWMEPGANTVERMVVERRSGQIASFDPNVRPSLINDRQQVIARVERLFADVHLVKLSEEDAAWLYPGQTPDQILDKVLEFGTGAAIVTLGSAGAVARAASADIALPARPVGVADTIGAGDSFMSGILAAWLESDLIDLSSLDDAAMTKLVQRGLNTAAITVSRPGANPPWRSELVTIALPRTSRSDIPN